MKYEFIVGLSDDFVRSKDSSLIALSQIWKQQESKLAQGHALQDFNEKIKRQWAIETGIIENLYTLDRGITVLLVEQGISEALIPHYASNRTSRELAEILGDHKSSIDGIFDYVRGNRDLSVSFIKQLHQSLNRHQPTTQAMDRMGNVGNVELLRGEWKRQPNNPLRRDGTTHEYCPPEHVQSEMDNLVKLYSEYSEAAVSPKVLSAWLHHRFTQVHPFQDGNGRVARAVASLVFIKYGWFPLVIDRDQRVQYIDALEKADTGNLTPLIEQFGANQKSYFIKALSISQDVIGAKATIDQIIKSAVSRIQKSSATIEEEKGKAITLADSVFDYLSEKLELLKKDLKSSFRSVDPLLRFDIYRCTTEHQFWYKYNVVTLAKELDFYANFSKYSNWMRFRIQSQEKFDILIYAVSVGEFYSGVIAFLAFVTVRSDEGESAQDYDLVRISPELFIVNYNDDESEMNGRFDKWYTDIVSRALTEWQRKL